MYIAKLEHAPGARTTGDLTWALTNQPGSGVMLLVRKIYLRIATNVATPAATSLAASIWRYTTADTPDAAKEIPRTALDTNSAASAITAANAQYNNGVLAGFTLTYLHQIVAAIAQVNSASFGEASVDLDDTKQRLVVRPGQGLGVRAGRDDAGGTTVLTTDAGTYLSGFVIWDEETVL